MNIKKTNKNRFQDLFSIYSDICTEDTVPDCSAFGLVVGFFFACAAADKVQSAGFLVFCLVWLGCSMFGAILPFLLCTFLMCVALPIACASWLADYIEYLFSNTKKISISEESYTIKDVN